MSDEVAEWNLKARSIADQMLVARDAIKKAGKDGDKASERKWRSQHLRLHVQLGKMIVNHPPGVTIPKAPEV